MFVHITRAAINAYRPVIKSNKEEDLKYAEKMVSLAAANMNNIFERVQKGSVSSRGEIWTQMEANDAVPIFPILSMDIYLLYIKVLK